MDLAVVTRVGHAFIKHRMRQEGAVFGGEVSGHYYFRDFSQARVVPFLLMLELISKRMQKLSESCGGPIASATTSRGPPADVSDVVALPLSDRLSE